MDSQFGYGQLTLAFPFLTMLFAISQDGYTYPGHQILSRRLIHEPHVPTTFSDVVQLRTALVVPPGTITLGTGNVSVVGSSDVINGVSGSTVILTSGDAGDIVTLNNGTVSVGSLDSYIEIVGTGNAITGAGQQVLGSGITTTVTGSYGYIGATNDVITAASLSGAGLNGSGDTLNLTGTAEAVGVFGSSDVVNAGGTGDFITFNSSGDTLNLTGTAEAVGVFGSSDVVNAVGAADTITVTGSGDTLTATGSSSKVILTSGDVGDTVNMSNGAIQVGAGSINVVGSTDNIYVASGVVTTINDEFSGAAQNILATNDTINALGLYNVAIAANGDTINLLSSTAELIGILGTGNTINANISGDLIDLYSNAEAQINGTNATVSFIFGGGQTVIGSFDTIDLMAGYASTITGSSNIVNGASGSTAILASGDVGNTVSMSNGTIDLGTGSVSVVGSIDVINGVSGSTVTLASGDVGDTVSMSTGTITLGTGNVSVVGSSDVINGVSGSTVILTSGDAGDIVTLNNGTVSVGSLDSYIEIVGTLNSIIGAGATTVSSGITTTVTGSYGYIGATNDVITAASLSGAGLNGSGDTLNLTGTAEAVGVFGSSDVVNAGGAGDLVTFNSSGDTLNLTGTAEAVGVFGSSDVVNAVGAADTITVTGSGDTLTATGSSSKVILTSGDVGDTVNMSNGAIQVGAGSINVVGSTDNIYVASGVVTTINDEFSGAAQNILATNDTINALGLYNVAIAANGDTINLLSSTAELIGILGTGNTINANISGDLVDLYSNAEAQINGTNAIVSAVFGGGQTIIASSDTIDLTAGYASTITGSGNIVNGGSGSTVILTSGDANNTISGDTIVMNNGTVSVGSLDTFVEIVGTGNSIVGAGETILGSGITTTVMGSYGYIGATNDVITAASLSGAGLNGSGNTLNLTGTAEAAWVFGSSDVVNAAGTGDSITFNSSGDTLNLTGTGQTVGFSGSFDVINVLSGNVLNASGSNDTINGTSAGTIDLTAGSNFLVSMNAGVLSVLDSVTGVAFTGSGDTIYGGAGDQITVTGSNDIINMNQGGTIVLAAWDTGDTINMIGGSVNLGASLSNIIINGTGDTLSGTDASLAGTITQEFVGNFDGTTFTIALTPQEALLQPGNITITPPIVYQAGDIPLLISYFEANPNLMDGQIAEAESDPNYNNDLKVYLSSNDIYGTGSTLPSNILAMLEGYSSVDIAVMATLSGTTSAAIDTDLAEATYIEQQFAWATSNYPIPTDYLTSDMQNLMAALMNPSTFTQGLVTEAIGMLQAGQAGAAQGNQTPMLEDSLAELVLAVAENPSISPTAILGDEVHTPGRSGHWQIEVNGTGLVVQETFKSPPLIETVVGDFEEFVVPIVQALAAVFQQWEVVAALSAVEAVQAGVDFAEGADLQGVFSVLDAIGGAFTAVGDATVTAIETANHTLDELQTIGGDLTSGVGVAAGIDGVVTSGNPAGIIISALGGINALGGVGVLNSSYDGLAGAALTAAETVSQYAAIGAALGSSAESFGTGNIAAGLASLVEGAVSAGIPVGQDVKKGIDALYVGFMADIYNPLANAASWLWQMTSSELDTIANGIVGVFDPGSSQSPGSTAPVSNVQAWETFGQSWGAYLITAAYQPGGGGACQIGPGVTVGQYTYGTSLMTAPNSTVQGLSTLNGCIDSVLGDPNQPQDENLGVYWGIQYGTYVTGQSLSQEMPALTSFVLTEESGAYTPVGAAPSTASLTASVPSYNGVPSTISGATILGGIDLSSKTVSELTSIYGVPAALANQWATDGLLATGPDQYGLRGSAAVNKLNTLTAANKGVNPVAVSITLANQMTTNEVTYYYNDTQTWYNNNVATAAPIQNFANLPEDTQIALIHMDLQSILQNSAYNLSSQVLNNQWVSVINNLGAWDPSSTYGIDTLSYFAAEKLILNDYLGLNSVLAPKGFNTGI